MRKYEIHPFSLAVGGERGPDDHSSEPDHRQNAEQPRMVEKPLQPLLHEREIKRSPTFRARFFLDRDCLPALCAFG